MDMFFSLVNFLFSFLLLWLLFFRKEIYISKLGVYLISFGFFIKFIGVLYTNYLWTYLGRDLYIYFFYMSWIGLLFVYFSFLLALWPFKPVYKAERR